MVCVAIDSAQQKPRRVFVPPTLNEEVYCWGPGRVSEMIAAISHQVRSGIPVSSIRTGLADEGCSDEMVAWILGQSKRGDSPIARSFLRPVIPTPPPIAQRPAVHVSLIGLGMAMSLFGHYLALLNLSFDVPMRSLFGVPSSVLGVAFGVLGICVVAAAKRKSAFFWGVIGVLLIGPLLSALMIAFLPAKSQFQIWEDAAH